MPRGLIALAAAAVGLFVLAAGPASAAAVKITPLGSHDGEFCAFDRAMIFEDPNGTRILYDAGRTVRGPDDPRLGRIDVVLLSHVHADHLGDAYGSGPNAGTCAKPDLSVKATPESNTVKIVVAKKAKLLVGGEMNAWLAKKVAAAGGSASQVEVLRFGASRTVGGVVIHSVPASHSNGLSPEFIDGDLGKQLAAAGLTAYVGPPGGYVLRFTNGLVVYLSGDTGMIAEQDLVIRRFFKASLVVMNIGDVYTTGPREAAYVINDLVKPRSVIPSHANEAATENGHVRPGTRTAIFIKATKAKVYLPLSGETRQFDGEGACVAGCT